MTSEKTRNLISGMLAETVALALEAEQVSLTHPKEARSLAAVAYKRAKQTSAEASDLATEGERRVVGLVSGQLAIHLANAFGLED